MEISTRSKNTKKKGPGFDTESAVSIDLDMGLAKLDPRIQVWIWILLL